MMHAHGEYILLAAFFPARLFFSKEKCSRSARAFRGFCSLLFQLRPSETQLASEVLTFLLAGGIELVQRPLKIIFGGYFNIQFHLQQMRKSVKGVEISGIGHRNGEDVT